MSKFSPLRILGEFWYDITVVLHNFSVKYLPKKKITNAKLNEKLFIITMLALPIASFLLFWVYVNYSTILMAFRQNVDGAYVFSLNNFKIVFENLFQNGTEMNMALINTLKFFVVSFAIITPFSLLLSYFLYKKIFLYRLFRVVFFLPSIISAVVLVTVYRFFIQVNGPLYELLTKIGMQNIPEWLSDSRYALTTIIIYCIWTGFGVNLILFNGALARIPVDVIEYSKIDGVSMPREFVSIIIPMIWPTISTVIVFAMVGLFVSSGPILLFTKGAYNTWTIAYWIFDMVAVRPQSAVELPAAIGLVFTAIGLPIVLFVKWILGKVYSDIEY